MVPPGEVHSSAPSIVAHLGALGQRHGDLAGLAAELAAVLPDRHGLGALGDAVQRGVVAVLPRDRDAVHALRRQRRHRAAGGAVVRGDDRVDVVVVRGQDLLHVALRVGGQPAVGIGLADDGDVARVDRLLQHLLLAAAQEVGVRVGGRALDHHVVAFGLRLQHGAGLHPADLDVVEGQVEGARVLDQAVVGRRPGCPRRRRPRRPGRWPGCPGRG